MNRDAHTSTQPSAGFLRRSLDEPDYARFYTDWYMPERGMTAESPGHAAPEPNPLAVSPAARPVMRPAGAPWMAGESRALAGGSHR